jgi:hypothetical protein
MEAEPAWIAEGAAVAECASDPVIGHLEFGVIDRLTPLWIVLGNGRRYYRTTRRLYGSATDLEELLPADDPKVRDILAAKILAGVFVRIRNLERAGPAHNTAAVLDVLDDIERAIRDARIAIDPG